MKTIPAIAVGALLWFVAPDASAGPNDNATSEPWAFQFGAGPQVNLEGGGLNGVVDADFQYHFKGGDVGPALGLQVPLHFDSNEVGMQVGPMFLWDFRVAQPNNIRIYVAPFVSSGFGFTHYTRDGPDDDTRGYWFLTFGPQLKVMFTKTIGVYVRPLSFDIIAGPRIVTGRWASTGGLAIAF